MIRIFPIYKGQELSKEGRGYSSIKSARKYMNVDPIMDDFKKLFDDDYWYAHHYLKYLDKSHRRIDTWVGYSYKTFTCDWYIDSHRGNVYLDKAPESLQPILKVFMSLYNNYWIKNIDRYKKGERMDELTLKLIDFGYSPHVYKDESDFKRKFSKFITENVQFVEKDVEIVVK